MKTQTASIIPAGPFMARDVAEAAAAAISAHIDAHGPIVLNGCPDTAAEWGLSLVEARRGPITRKWGLYGTFARCGGTWLTGTSLDIIRAALEAEAMAARLTGIPCPRCKEYREAAFDQDVVAPLLPRPYGIVACQLCRQVNRATGQLVGLERAYVFCRCCPAVVQRDAGPYCPRHADN